MANNKQGYRDSIVDVRLEKSMFDGTGCKGMKILLLVWLLLMKIPADCSREIYTGITSWVGKR